MLLVVPKYNLNFRKIAKGEANFYLFGGRWGGGSDFDDEVENTDQRYIRNLARSVLAFLLCYLFSERILSMLS